jgi:hypothetical protein
MCAAPVPFAPLIIKVSYSKIYDPHFHPINSVQVITLVMFALRTEVRSAARHCSLRASLSHFHSSAPRLVKIGDALPDVEVMESSPGNKVNIFTELKGKGLIIGVPAAYCKTLNDLTPIPPFHPS